MVTRRRILPLLICIWMAVTASAARATEHIYYFHNDHLGTPQSMSDASGRKVWEAEYDPFGKATVNQDPDGDGQIVVNNLRFPGQYYDAETGLHYNYHRDYDPATGRYLQPDPIGMEGGLNHYAYGGDNPISNIDPDGLFFWPWALPWAEPVIGATCKAIATVTGIIMTCAAGEKVAEKIKECKSPTDKWTCVVQCQVILYGPGNPHADPPYVRAYGYGKTEPLAEKNAEAIARSMTPRGCRTRHCRKIECWQR